MTQPFRRVAPSAQAVPPSEANQVPPPEPTAIPEQHEEAPEAVTMAFRRTAPATPGRSRGPSIPASVPPAPPAPGTTGEPIATPVPSAPPVGAADEPADDVHTVAFRGTARPGGRLTQPPAPPPASPPRPAAVDEAPETRTVAFRRSGTNGSAPNGPAVVARPIEEVPPEALTLPGRRGSAPPVSAPTPIPAEKPAAEAVPGPQPTPTRRTRRSNPFLGAAPVLLTSNTESPPAAAAPAPPPPAETTAGVKCPRCGGRLISPESLGLCQACGYCRSLEEGRSKVLAPTAARFRLRDLFNLDLLGRFLGVFWLLLAGLAGVILVSVVGNRLLVPESQERALWGTLQAALGALSILVAQLWALVLLLPHDDRLGAKDLLLPLRLWGLSWRGLPATRGPVSLACWGVALIAFAVFQIGGLTYWLDNPRGVRERAAASSGETLVDKGLREAAAYLERDEPKSQAAKKSVWSSALHDLNNSIDAAAVSISRYAREGWKDDKRPTTQCVVIGYTSRPNGEPDGLVLATVRDGAFRYAGVVRDGVQDALKTVQQRLGGQEQGQSPLGNSGFKATWLEPKVFVEIHSSGLEPKGTLKDPNFKSLLAAPEGEKK